MNPMSISASKQDWPEGILSKIRRWLDWMQRWLILDVVLDGEVILVGDLYWVYGYMHDNRLMHMKRCLK